MCTAGTYKADFGSWSCKLCAIGKCKSGLGIGVCSSCDEGKSTAATGSTSAEACTLSCRPGEYANGCACVAGKWKNGKNTLTACFGQSECPDSGDFAYQNDEDKTRCHQRRHGTSQCCKHGQYYEWHELSSSTATYEWCPRGTYSSKIRIAYECDSCVSGATTNGAGNLYISRCRCNHGCGAQAEYNDTDPESLVCTECPLGKYKHHRYSGKDCNPNAIACSVPCTFCDAGKTSQRGSVEGSNCLPVQIPMLCAPGMYVITAAECLPCPAGTWKNGTNNRTSCDDETQCPGYVDGQVLRGDGQDTIPSHVAWQHNADKTRCHMCGSATINCCPAGQGVLLAANQCDMCKQSKYTSSVTLYTLACAECPAATSHADRGAGSISACQCNQGYGGADGGPCTECGIGRMLH